MVLNATSLKFIDIFCIFYLEVGNKTDNFALSKTKNVDNPVTKQTKTNIDLTTLLKERAKL